jgi:hypothetical protein
MRKFIILFSVIFSFILIAKADSTTFRETIYHNCTVRCSTDVVKITNGDTTEKSYHNPDLSCFKKDQYPSFSKWEKEFVNGGGYYGFYGGMLTAFTALLGILYSIIIIGPNFIWLNNNDFIRIDQEIKKANHTKGENNNNIDVYRERVRRRVQLEAWQRISRVIIGYVIIILITIVLLTYIIMCKPEFVTRCEVVLFIFLVFIAFLISFIYNIRNRLSDFISDDTE